MVRSRSSWRVAFFGAMILGSKRKSGARGLRSVMEDAMLDIMYEIPSIDNVKECVISEDVVLKKEDPILLYEQTKKQA